MKIPLGVAGLSSDSRARKARTSSVVDAHPDHVRKARHRRDLFSDAFRTLDDVRQVIPSGSLARGTQLDPIHDVDLIVVFDTAAHPSWGESGGSAGVALSYVEEKVNGLLGAQVSIVRRVVGETLLRNHVVKCFLDPRFLAQDPDFRSFFAVEVMPALRAADGALLVPERRNERWQKADPEWLIAEVRRRQELWEYFVRMIRIVKFWMRHVNSGVKPLAAEVLALKCLPDPPTGLSRSVASERFFTAASTAVMLAVRDPAGHCGVIQPGLDRTRASSLLGEAAGIAARAVAWEQKGEHEQAICCWRAIFGEDFPLPPGGCPGWGDGGGGGGGGGTAGPEPGDGQPREAPPPGDGDGQPSGDGPSGRDDYSGGGGGGGGGGGTRRRPVIPPVMPPGAPRPSGPVKDAPQG
jgi:hypothetical protein